MLSSEIKIKPQDILLWLPLHINGQVLCDRWLARIEWNLHDTQVHEALDAGCYNLQIYTHLYQFKDWFIRGQSANTVGQKTVPMFGCFVNIDSLRHNHLRLKLEIFICDTLL